MTSISLCFSLFCIWPSITAEEITKILKDIILFIFSKPDEFSLSRMHDTMNKETGLQERNKIIEKVERTKKGEVILCTDIKMRVEVLFLFTEVTALL